MPNFPFTGWREIPVLGKICFGVSLLTPVELSWAVTKTGTLQLPDDCCALIAWLKQSGWDGAKSYFSKRNFHRDASRIFPFLFMKSSSDLFEWYCQTPIPGQTWELTLFSHGNNNKKKNKKKNPHPNSPRRVCAMVLKFCMRPSDTKRIRLHP